MACGRCFLIITLFILLYYYGVVALGLQATVTVAPSPQNITINFYPDNSVIIDVAGLNPLSEFTYEINLTTTSDGYLFVRYWSEGVLKPGGQCGIVIEPGEYRVYVDEKYDMYFMLFPLFFFMAGFGILSILSIQPIVSETEFKQD